MENDEKKYEDVIKALKGLQEVKAPENFEADLKRRISQEKFSKEEKKSFWQNILVPARLIPSLGLLAAAVVIFFVIELRTEEVDNPFLIEPKVREDVYAVKDFEEVELKRDELSKQKSLKKEQPSVEQKTNESRLKSSESISKEDNKLAGREKSDTNDLLRDEKDTGQSLELVTGAYSAVESTLTTVPENPQPTISSESTSEIRTSQVITKEELNFRQIQLTDEQRKAVNELKNQFQSIEKANKTQK